MKATVLILLDAFRTDYIDKETTPFLYSCAQKGHHVKKIIPSFGFCERAEILSGRTPVQTGYFTAIGYDPLSSPYKNFSTLLTSLSYVEKILPFTFVAKVVRRVIKSFVKSHPHSMKPYRIPLNLLDRFSLTEDYFDHRDPRAFDGQDVLSAIKNEGLSYFYDSFTALNLITAGSDADRFDLALDAADNEHVFYLVFNSVPDALGHKHGGDSDATKEGLRAMDGDLERFVEQFEAQRKGTQFLFVGDHGMVDVEENLDVQSIILKLAKASKLRQGKDFTYFLDSTLCRVWAHTERARIGLLEPLLQRPELLSRGQFIDHNLAQELHIPFGDERYGDIMWWCNPGIMIFPDFFHLKNEKVKGMHGYDNKHQHSMGKCIVFGGNQQPKVTEELNLSEINGLIRESLSVQTGIDFRV